MKILPFLVSRLALERPLLGFNVLEEVIQAQPEQLVPTVTTLLCIAMLIPIDKAELLVNFIQTSKPSVQCGHIRTGRQDIVTPAGQVAWIKWQVLLSILFEPDDNALLADLDVGGGLLGALWMGLCSIWTVECPCSILVEHGASQRQVLHPISWQCALVCKDIQWTCWGTPQSSPGSPALWSEIEPGEMWAVQTGSRVCGPPCVSRGYQDRPPWLGSCTSPD